MKCPALLTLLTLIACDPVGNPTPPDAGGLPANCQRIDPSTDLYLGCTGTFLKGQVAKLCPQGYVVMFRDMPSSLRTICDLTLSTTKPDVFYAVDVGSWSDPASPFSKTACAASATYSMPGLMGCGTAQNATAFTGQGATACQNWPHAVVCPKSSGWNCPDGILQTATNSNPAHGVVCTRL